MHNLKKKKKQMILFSSWLFNVDLAYLWNPPQRWKLCVKSFRIIVNMNGGGMPRILF